MRTFIPLESVMLAGLWLMAAWAQAGETEAAYALERDIVYRDDSDAPLDDYMQLRCRLNFYHPVGESNFPTLVWFHGGGLTGGNRYMDDRLKEQGFAVAAATYRLSPRATCPAYLEDAAAAVAWAFRNVERYGGDPDRIFVSGFSAGGYLALMVGLDKQWLGAYGIDADRLAGIVSFSGQTITHFTIREERGVSRLQPVIDEFAPLYHVRPDAPPLLLLTGDRELELWGRTEENAYLARMMKVVGHKDVTHYEFRGFGHGMRVPGNEVLLRYMKGK